VLHVFQARPHRLRQAALREDAPDVRIERVDAADRLDAQAVLRQASTLPIASMRRLSFARREPSPRPVVPSSPVRV
jgi:hypothetical protein